MMYITLLVTGKLKEAHWRKAEEEYLKRLMPYTKITIKELKEENPGLVIEFEEGTPVAVNGKKLSPAQLLEDLNFRAGKHGVGRVDIVENKNEITDNTKIVENIKFEIGEKELELTEIVFENNPILKHVDQDIEPGKGIII